ncbi:MAG TPA: phosphatase PAP2 family protein [Rhizomicrobium sp.]|jgi:acid phosphatase (class A)
MKFTLSLFVTSALCMGVAHAAMLDPASIEPGQFLPPPPAEKSAAAMAEMKEVNDIIAHSSPVEIAAAAKDDGDEGPDIYNMVLGFDVKDRPQTMKLLTMVAEEEETDTKRAKTFFHRKRPWVIDPTVKTCTLETLNQIPNSYPSGHATLGYSLGVVLTHLMPEKSQAILGRAAEYAEHRLVCGMHFRADVVASQQYGTVLALRLMENSAFMQQMGKAKAELQQAGR